MRQRLWQRRRVWALVAALLMMPLGPIGHAAAAEPPAAAPAQGAMALFEGHSIDLSKGWGEAHACFVRHEGNECFRTPQAMEAREAQLGLGHKPSKEQDGAVTASYAYSPYSCSSSLRLYDYSWYGGRQLGFWDRGFWQNLWYYGFDDSTESYAVGACYAHLAEYSDGYGWWYPGPTYPWAGEGDMGGWSNVISSIYIE